MQEYTILFIVCGFALLRLAPPALLLILIHALLQRSRTGAEVEGSYPVNDLEPV